MTGMIDIDAAVAALSPAFRGALLRPADAGYAKARSIYNMRRAESKPALIAQASDADDVATFMRWASAGDVPVAIRSGGHGVDGSAMPDGAIVIDLSRLKTVTVDTLTNRVRAGAGVLLGEIDRGAQDHGLVVPSGTVSTTGIAGLTLGGGVGYLMRRFGATVDNLLACEMVAADGRQVRADATQNADLFWALRGGSGNFGIVTAFEYQGHKLGPEVAGGFILYTIDQAEVVLRKLREHMPRAPRELSMIAALTPCPPLPPIPADLHGKPVLMLVTVYTGPVDELEAVLAPLMALGNPTGNYVQRAPWVVVNSMLDEIAPYGRRVHTRGGYFTGLDDDTLAIMLDFSQRPPVPSAPGPSSVQNIWFMGGAISEDFEEESVAFSRENATIFWECVGQWDGDEHDDDYVAWVTAVGDALNPHMLTNGYCNLTTDLGPDWLSGLYGHADKYRRLQQIKAAWDPRNLFRYTKNILPARETVAA